MRAYDKRERGERERRRGMYIGVSKYKQKRWIDKGGYYTRTVSVCHSQR